MVSFKALHPRRFRMSPMQLEEIFPLCTSSLKAFTYEASEVISLHVDQKFPYMVQSSDGVRHLEKHSTSLESLHIDLRIRTYMSRDTKIYSMPNLGSFTALQELLLNSDAVYNTQSLELSDQDSLASFLPPNITSLTLDLGNLTSLHLLNAYGGGLADLKKREPGRFPGLGKVICDTENMFDKSHGHPKDVLSQAGISLEYKEFPRSDWIYDRERLVVSPLFGRLSSAEDEFPDHWLL
ncbi:hypothetical protein F53441_2384 [Fusarium austroafricanum]|uniref:Uncharacterized protein n=1 Tax=Fusarium austroafricanum TaxID=2364996 RepID=A0A8H4NXW0_9HYPO|nr:hypothetical protein F53441_2384 [Fusarium austroafricanum]